MRSYKGGKSQHTGLSNSAMIMQGAATVCGACTAEQQQALLWGQSRCGIHEWSMHAALHAVTACTGVSSAERPGTMGVDTCMRDLPAGASCQLALQAPGCYTQDLEQLTLIPTCSA